MKQMLDQPRTTKTIKKQLRTGNKPLEGKRKENKQIKDFQLENTRSEHKRSENPDINNRAEKLRIGNSKKENNRVEISRTESSKKENRRVEISRTESSKKENNRVEKSGTENHQVENSRMKNRTEKSPSRAAFEPELVFFEPGALDYPLGQELMERFKAKNIPIKMTTSHNRVTGIPGDTPAAAYRNAKRTLVVGVRKTLKFDTSKPSAEYAIPLATGCMGHCHYCYLQTTMGSKPYIRTYVNLEDIFDQAKAYIEERKPEITRFEAACTSDPVGLDHITHSLKKTIEFMGQQEFGRLRFVTKYHHVDHLLDVQHNQHTRFRFSLNADYVIKHFEPATSSFQDRIEAAGKVARAGYPLGFILAPLMRFEGWKEGYRELFVKLDRELIEEARQDLTFELIMHRFTKTAKRVILERYPKTKLEMEEENRKYKWGRYGRGKYVYRDEEATELKEYVQELIRSHFPQAKIEYFT